MWQSKREISRECNDIIGLAKGSQINEKVRKRRGHILLNETSACETDRGNCSYDNHNMAEVEIGKIVFC
jgi:hypothetical protein